MQFSYDQKYQIKELFFDCNYFCLLSGIVEPAIYGLGVKFKTPLIAGCLGAAMGGAFMGAFNVIGNAFVFGGLTTIPAFAGPTLWAYIVGLVIAFLVE